MEFRDLKTQYKVLKDRIDRAMMEVATEGNYIMGRQVIELEQQLAEYVGTKYCITCANGTDALTLLLMAWGIKEGDAVFVPDFTFFATGEVVAFEGATPVFIDINESTYNIDCRKLEEEIVKVKKEGKLNPKAIISVDLFGLPADYEALENIAKKYGLLLLEDSAQGFGGKIGERRAGSFGDAATTSFFPAKPLGCYGDGGAIFTNDAEIATLLYSLRVHGKGTCKYDNVRIGMNSRLDTLQAAILLEKFKAFVDYELEAVNKIAQYYTEQLQTIIKTPMIPEGYYSSWAQYCIQFESEEKRGEVVDYLKSKGIPTMIYYPKPMSMQKAFKNIEESVRSSTVAYQVSRTILALPMHPYLREEEVEEICKFIREKVN